METFSFVGQQGENQVDFSIIVEDDTLLDGMQGRMKAKFEAHKGDTEEKTQYIDPGVLRRIVLDAFAEIRDGQKRIEIKVTGFNDTDVTYEITDADPDQPKTKKIALTIFDQEKFNKTRTEIEAYKIVSTGHFVERTGLETLVEHYAVVEKNPGPFDAITDLLADFFAKIVEMFYFVEVIYNAVSHKKREASLQWDLELMAATCGVAINPNITVAESLSYLSAMMERETQVDPALKQRVADGASLGRELVQLRDHFGFKAFTVLEKKVSASVKAIEKDQKMLIPISYVKNGQSIQMLLEIGRNETDFTVTLISNSEETRALFDRELGLKTNSQSVRREITGVQEKDLLAILPTLIELDTVPECRTSGGGSWENTFMQTFILPNTRIEAGDVAQVYVTKKSPSHVSETLAYVVGQQDPAIAQRFELATRLQIFLDVTKKNTKSLKDPRYWRLVRTSAYQLARMIETNKQVITTTKGRATELGLIYGELNQVLEQLDRQPPEFVDLRAQVATRLRSLVDVNQEPAAPPLITCAETSKLDVRQIPAFTLCNPKTPGATIQTWAKRCSAFIKQGDKEKAFYEANLMVRMLPSPEELFPALVADSEKNSPDDVLEALFNIFKALGEPPSDSFYNMTSLSVLSNYIYTFISKMGVDSSLETRLADQLLVSRLSEQDQRWLLAVRAGCTTAKGKFEPITPPLPQLPQSADEKVRKLQRKKVEKRQKEIDTKADRVSTGVSVYLNSIEQASTMPICFRPPIYAQTVAREIANRYTTEYCCLGCIRDNCEYYNRTPYKNMRFHPLYMLHNFVDTFCKELVNRGNLHRDEVAALLYTQQTNANANFLWKFLCHSNEGSILVADKFDKDDQRLQVMNTLGIFTENPHFFRQPDLCWQFEERLFTQEAFKTLLAPTVIQQYKPFLMSAFRKLTKEIAVSYAAGNTEVAGYLLYVSNRLTDLIDHAKNPTDPETRELYAATKTDLRKLLRQDTGELLLKWSKELVSKTDDRSRELQRMILPLLMNHYHDRFIRDHKDLCFQDRELLTVLFMSSARIEELQQEKTKIDPEVYARYKALMSWLLPYSQREVIKSTQDKTGFIKEILMVLHPEVAELPLDWESENMCAFVAMDKKTHTVYEYNLETGRLDAEGKKNESIPENYQTNTDLQQLFGEAVREDWQVQRTPLDYPGLSVFAYTHSGFPKYRILLKTKSASSAEKRLVIERLVTTSGKKQTWVIYHRFEEQDQMKENGKLESSADMNLQMAQLIGDRQCWVSSDGKRMYVLEESGNIYAILKLKKDTYTSKRIITDFYLAQERCHVLAPTSDMMERFSFFEDPKFIIVSGRGSLLDIVQPTPTAHPDTIQFSRYRLMASEVPLVYNLDRSRITTPAFEGYELAPYGVRAGSRDLSFGVVPLPSAFDGYHLLRREGEEKVLTPFCQFEQDLNVEGEALRSTHAVFTDEYKKVPLYEFAVDPDSNRLIAQSGDAYAYLAYLSSSHWDYASAVHYLEKAKTSAGYNQNYDQVFNWLDSWHDDSPNGVAMRLRFELFKESVFDERRIQAIARGDVQVLGAAEITRANRLISIADLYAQYCEHTKQASEEAGRSTFLNLLPEQLSDVKLCVRNLISEKGAQPVETDEPTLLRGSSVPLQEYMDNERLKETTGVRYGTLAMWVSNGTRRYQPRFSVQNPIWVVRHFRDLFNRLSDLEPDSVEFKKLVHQLRMVSEFIPKDFDSVERGQIIIAQSYLLKLASAYIENNQDFLTALEAKLKDRRGYYNLFNFRGAFFSFRRASQLKFLNSVMQEDAQLAFDHFDLFSKPRAEATAKAILKFTPKPQDVLSLDPFLSKKKALSKKVLAFLGKSKLPRTGLAFHQAFRKFLLQEIFGTRGEESIRQLDDIFALFDDLTITQPEQKLAPPSPQPVAAVVTYQERYGPLLAEMAEAEVDLSKLRQLEAEVVRVVVTEPPEEITTLDDQKKVVLASAFQEDEKKVVPERPFLERAFADYVTLFTTAPKAAVAVSENIFNRLSRSVEKAFQRVSEEHREDLHAFQKETETITLTRQKAEELHGFIDIDLAKVKESREETRVRLLQYVERFNTPAGIMALRRMVGADAKPSLDVLIALWRQNEIVKDWKENPLKTLGFHKMQPAVLRELDEQIAAYLLLDAQEHLFQSSLDTCVVYLDSCPRGADSLGEEQLAQELWGKVQTKRQFLLTDADARDLLYLEYNLSIILREGQVKTLREMLFDPNAVRQLIMGGGKSKVLLPMLARRKATGGNLVMLMLPDELYETNCRDLDVTNRLLFRQEMHRFNFSRSSDRSEASLLKIYQMLLETIKDRGFVMTTKGSMLSFKNAYIELLYKLQNLPPDSSLRPAILAEVKVMSKILQIFQNQTDVLADEVDACLDVRKEVNFSLGDVEKIDQVKIDVGMDLMQVILDPKEKELHELREAVEKNMQAVMPPERRRELLTLLVRAYYTKHSGQFTAFELDAFINYIMDENIQDTAVRDAVLKLQENPEAEDATALFHQIVTLKAFINRGFGTTFGRIGNVNYGRDPVSQIWTIPYTASNTPHVGSDFDDDIERLSFTYQDYLQNGVTYPQVYKTVARLFNQAVEELRARKGTELVGMNETKAAANFEEFLQLIDPEKQFPNLALSSCGSPQQIRALLALINDTPKAKLNFCHMKVAAEMRRYRAQINSNSQDLVEMVHHFGGFTGTLWNRHTYHDKINAQKEMGVDGQTWALMLGRNPPIHAFVFDADKPIDSLVDELQVVGQYQAVIDAGAYLRGVDNHEFIDVCMQRATDQGIHIGGGIYFDRIGRIVKKGGIGEREQPIETAPPTDRMTDMTLYDQGHTVGADIKQGRQAKAIVTVGENTFLRDLFQAVWRLRQLHQEQGIEIAISKDIKTHILKGKTEGDRSTITLEDILSFCLQNEANREAEDNFRAEKARIQGSAKRYGYREMVELVANDTIDDDGILEMAQKLATPAAKLFIKQPIKEETYDEYGQSRQEETPDKTLARLRAIAATHCDELATLFTDLHATTAAEGARTLSAAVENRPLPDLALFPNAVDSSIGAEGSEVELEAEAEASIELETEQETFQETEVDLEVIVPMIHSGGEAGSGDVYPLRVGDIDHVINNRWNRWYTERSRPLGISLSFFDRSIFTSAVFERNLPLKGEEVENPRTVFYSNRKPVMYVLITKDKDGKFGMIIPTIHEAHSSCRDWISKTNLEAVEVKISNGAPLVMYKSGADRTDALPFTTPEALQQFYRFYIQAKLLNGDIVFETEEEKTALRAWLKEVGVDQFAEYFREHILSAKPRRIVDTYPTSSLFAIIQEVHTEAS